MVFVYSIVQMTEGRRGVLLASGQDQEQARRRRLDGVVGHLAIFELAEYDEYSNEMAAMHRHHHRVSMQPQRQCS